MLPCRVLIVGYGSIGKRHLVVIREVLPLADIRIFRSRITADPTEAANSFLYTLDELSSFNPEIAIIASPAPFHIGIAKILAKAGCHLLIEKPLAEKSKGLRKFFKQLQKEKIILQVGYNLRFLPSLQELKRNVDNNVMGKVLSVRCEVGQYLPSWRPGTDYRKGVSAQKKLGGGVLLELSHEIDYISWIFGEVIWVSAWIGKVSDLETDVEDCAHLIMGLNNTFSENLVVILTMDFFRHDSVRKCNIVCKEGTLIWDGIEGTILKHSLSEGETNFIFKSPEKRNDTFTAQFNHFLDSISNQTQPCISGYDGWKTLKVVEAAKKSYKKGGKRIRIQ